MKLSFVLAAATSRMSAILITPVSGYDINCLYPDEMPDPTMDTIKRARNKININTVARVSETPISIYLSGMMGNCPVGCLSYHDDTMLNPLTMERPSIVDVPSFGYNTFSRAMCTLQCYYSLGVSFGRSWPGGNSDALDEYESLMEDWGLDLWYEDLRDARYADFRLAWDSGNYDDINAMIVAENYHPFAIGHLVALEVESLSKNNNDGWNRDGSHTYGYNEEDDTWGAIPCSTNCAPFSDTTGYKPIGTTNVQGDKYNVTGLAQRWQPLREQKGVGIGSYVHQVHITPHIGFTVKPKLRPLIETEAPTYTDYHEEALSVVEQLRLTAGNETRKAMVEFYDNKGQVRSSVIRSITSLDGFDGSLEDTLLLHHGIDLVEHDALLSAWRGKVKYDLVRPTTVIRQWGNDEIDTFGGDFSETESKVIKAKDFEAVIRVMPHSEYPSGSASICKAYADFARAYTEGVGLDEPVVKKPWDIPDMEAITLQCGESRLWGGMHFSASIPAGYKIVEGMGKLGYDRIKEIRNGSNFSSKWQKGIGRRRPNNSLCGQRTDSNDAAIEEKARAAPAEVSSSEQIYLRSSLQVYLMSALVWFCS